MIKVGALDRARELASALDRARELAHDPSVGGKAAGVRVAPTAGRLLAAAARLLPAGERVRYAAEYRSELWEIAHAGTGRRGQLAYAARQVVSSPRVRAELRVLRQRKATMTAAAKAVLRHAGKAAAGVLPASLLARLGLPVLGTLVFLAVLALMVACWVIGSGDRTERVSRILLAGRGDASCLPPAPTALPPPASRPRRRPAWRAGGPGSTGRACGS